MPGSIFSGLLERRARSQALAEQIAARQQAAIQQQQMREMLLQQTQAYINARMQNNPRTQLMQQKYDDAKQQNLAYSNYIMGIDPSTVPPEMRAQLAQMKQYLAANPGLASSGVAKMFIPHLKPHGIQLKATTTFEYDADGNPVPVTTYSAWDPMTHGLGAVSAAPGVGATGASPPSAAAKAPSEADRLEKSLDTTFGGP